jgi:hypothetical protein
MPVVKVERFVLRGKIRAQVQYAIVLGNRILKADTVNPSLGLFAAAPLPADRANFTALVAYWQGLLLQKDS